MKPAELIEWWRGKALSLAAYGADAQAVAVNRCANELEEALRDGESETLTIPQASLESGFSQDHLRRLIAEGRLTNAGRKGKPRVRRRDLPRKAGHPLRESEGGSHFSDRSAVVASVIPRRAS